MKNNESILFAAHCRPRSCGRQRATSHPTKEAYIEITSLINEGTPVGNRVDGPTSDN